MLDERHSTPMGQVDQYKIGKLVADAKESGGSELAKNLVGNSQVPAAEMEVL